MSLLKKILPGSRRTISLCHDNPFFLYDSDKIRKVLYEISGISNVISLYFPDEPGVDYATSLTRLGGQELLFDRVGSEEGHTRLMEEKSFRALSKYRGVPITFDCALFGLVYRGEKAWYKASFPERLYYPQKREVFRVPVADLQLPIRIKSKPGLNLETKVIEGMIDDIGLHGLSFNIDPVMHFRKFDIVRGCSYETTSGETVDFNLEVRAVRSVRGGAKVRVGGRYVGLTSRNHRHIQRDLLILQRMVKAQQDKKEKQES